MISKEKKTAIINEYARFEGDTGSPEVQIAVLTARMEFSNLKDQNSRLERRLKEVNRRLSNTVSAARDEKLRLIKQLNQLTYDNMLLTQTLSEERKLKESIEEKYNELVSKVNNIKC